MNHNFKFENGLKVKDIITGFEGTITGRVNYLTGCDNYLLAPKVDKEDKKIEAEWYDENRLEIIPKKEKVKVNDSKDNGACESAPRRQ